MSAAEGLAWYHRREEGTVGEDAAREALRLRALMSHDGRVGPIEARLGRRLLRLLDPVSREGQALLREGRVELVAPGGDTLGRLTLEEAQRRLRSRLEARLADAGGEMQREALLEGLRRLGPPPAREGRS